ncbi:MAG: PrsW family glutamic-type intramembrane protease [Candidatus Taylorbacteria bacterium]|nr:PrsW family glutamic-type intramembrane protease [Candidatus Taylorbacteria bacterium]
MIILYALLAGVLPALLWLWFWLREDNLHPEPRSLITKSFLGGMVAVALAVIFEKYAFDIISDQVYRYITWAAIEEIVKFMAVALIALHSRHMDEPIDAMIYCISVALGFSALENALFILSPLDSGHIMRGIVTGNMRFIGATLVHTVCSAIIGFMIGITYYKNVFWKTLALVLGLILAIVLHAGFNLSIIDETVTNTLKVFSWVWIAVVILIILFEEIKSVREKIIK